MIWGWNGDKKEKKGKREEFTFARQQWSKSYDLALILIYLEGREAYFCFQVFTHAATVPARRGGRGKTIVGTSICKYVAKTYET